MPSSFQVDLDRGFGRPVRYRLGEAVNVWASKTNELAERLDSLGDQVTPEVAAVLRELFEEIGQQARDTMGIVYDLQGFYIRVDTNSNRC